MIGCPINCKHCSLSGKFIRGLRQNEIFEQVVMMLNRASAFTDINCMHKISLGKSGEPLANPYTIHALRAMSLFGFSFKVSTVFPSGQKAKVIFDQITEFAKLHEQTVQLQISVISTSEQYRYKIARNTASFNQLQSSLEKWIQENPQPKGRKPNISLIVAKEIPLDPKHLLQTIPPNLANIRLRPYVPTSKGQKHGLNPIIISDLKNTKKRFEDCGYTVSLAGIPTPIEQKFKLSSNSTLERYKEQVK